MRRLFLFSSLLVSLAILSGCSNDEPAKTYDIRGKVVSLNVEQKTVRINHEEIPGLMKAMEMNFNVDDPKLLEGLSAGDAMTGKLRAGAGKYVLIELHKVAAAAGSVPSKETDEAAEIKANLAQLGPEDEKLASAQRVCAVSGEALGSMDVPLKVMVKGQAVFICCKSCQGSLEKEPDFYLKKVADLKAQGTGN